MYCRNCGQKFNVETDKFCSKCGSSFYLHPPRRKKKSTGPAFGLVIIFIIVGTLSPFILNWLIGDCGVIPVSGAIGELDVYASDIKQLEDATINNKKPPAYLLAKIDGDISTVRADVEGCTASAYASMNNALIRASIYFGDLPTFEMTDARLAESYGGYMIEQRQNYETALRNYYSEIGRLKACHPYCNIDKVFVVDWLPSE